jgi:hypothetical protein
MTASLFAACGFTLALKKQRYSLLCCEREAASG